MRATEIGELLSSHGFEATVWGDTEVIGVSAIKSTRPATVAFWRQSVLPEPHVVESIAAGVLVLAMPPIAEQFHQKGTAAIEVSDPRAAFAVVSSTFHSRDLTAGIHPTAVVDPESSIHPSASIGAGTVIGKATLGARTRIGHNCVIHSGVTIGEDVEVGDLTVLGGPGFGYVTLPSGATMRIPHVGGVVVGDGVHIGSHVAVDRGTLEDTVLQAQCRIDNLVHIAHNVNVGRSAMVIAGAEISGGVRIGDHAWIAPQASIREQIHVGDHAVVGLGSVVVKDVSDGTTVMGVPARPRP